MIVVADTSPILNLERVGRLSLLQALYGQVVIPEAVFVELSVPGTLDFSEVDWLRVVHASNQDLVGDLMKDVDPGEAEAIAIATELGADLLLIDERRARALASARGLTITGLAGVLISAKHAKLLHEVRPVLDDLVALARFRISTELYFKVLSLAGESQE